jgi:putative component of membrane protein insertase Oxa1/YidC/SpoIIIJ protein YidD
MVMVKSCLFNYKCSDYTCSAVAVFSLTCARKYWLRVRRC